MVVSPASVFYRLHELSTATTRLIAAYLAACGLVGCGSDSTPFEPTSLQCGALNPGLYVYCAHGPPPPGTPYRVERTDSDLVSVPEGGDGISGSLRFDKDECILDPHDAGTKVWAQYRASCVVAGFTRGYELFIAGNVERICSNGKRGSTAAVRPVWTLPLNLGAEAELHRVELHAETDSPQRLEGCSISVDDREGDPVDPGESRIFMEYLPPGEHRIVVDCSAEEGLVSATCIGHTLGVLGQSQDYRSLKLSVHLDH